MNDQVQTGRIEIQQQEQLAIANAALRGGVSRVYANGFIVARSLSDVSVVMLTNGAPTSVLSVSYIAAKTLIAELSKAINDFEKALGETIPTMEEVRKKLEAMEE